MEYVFFIILGIGALVIGIPILMITIALWYITIPLMGLYLGGIIGFIFGVGLVIVLYGIYSIIKEIGPFFEEIIKLFIDFLSKIKQKNGKILINIILLLFFPLLVIYFFKSKHWIGFKKYGLQITIAVLQTTIYITLVFSYILYNTPHY